MLFATMQFEPEEEGVGPGGGGRTTAIVLGLIAALLIAVPLAVLFLFVRRDGGGETRQSERSRAQIVFDGPLDGDSVVLGEEIEVLVSVDDPDGIETVELRAGGRTVGTLSGEDGEGDPPQFTFFWTPDRVGRRRLEAIETNLDGERSQPASITVTVVRPEGTPGPETTTPTGTETEIESPTPTETETETPTPTPTVREGALPGVATGSMNVREEPSDEAALIGSLEAGDEVEVVGRTEDGKWLEIIFPPTTDSTGWVFADFIDVDGDVEDLPVTAEPTETPTPEEEVADLVPTQLKVQAPSNSLILTIRNKGAGDLEGSSVTVSVKVGGPPADESLTLALDLPALSAGEDTELPLGNLRIYTERTISVLVDSSNTIEEEDEENNSLEKRLGPAATADLSLEDFNLIGADNHLVIKISNLGEADLVDAAVVITVRTPQRQLAKVTQSLSIQPDGSTTIEIPEATVSKETQLTVTLDAEGWIDEEDEENNAISKTLSP